MKQISSYTSIRSFKGSPYWMAPEVRCLWWNLLHLILPMHIIFNEFLFGFSNLHRLSWIAMDTIYQWIYGALVVQFLRWPPRNLLGVNMKGYAVDFQWILSKVRKFGYCYRMLPCNPNWIIFSCKPWTSQVAAIFKIGNSKDIPEIPDHISAEGKHFLKLCLQRDPAARPTAVQLMDLPFVRDQSAIKSAKVNRTMDISPSSFDGSHMKVLFLKAT